MLQLWEASQAENSQLRLEMAEVRVELEDTRRRLREALLVSVLLYSTVKCSTVHYPFFKSDVLDFNSSSTSHFNKCIF